MIVSANQFFAMSPAERELVTEIDLTLDDTDRIYAGAVTGRMTATRNIEEVEPGTDWIKP